jgi:ABC-type Fe3+/spermidine/putrescine transport system ATPase subunit
MIATHDLSCEHGPKLALSGLNLRVDPCEILGFLGPNGAGSPQRVKILTGMIRPTCGTARVAGCDVVEQPLEVKQRIGYVPETAALYDALTAGEYLELIGCLHHLDRKTADTRVTSCWSLLAHLVLQIGLLLDLALPFSRPMQQTRVTGFFLGFTFVAIVLSLFIQFYSARIYNNVATTVAAIAAIVFIGIVVDLITRARVQRQAQLLEFEG